MRVLLPLVLIALIGTVSYTVMAEQASHRQLWPEGPQAAPEAPAAVLVAQADPADMDVITEIAQAPVVTEAPAAPAPPVVDETALRYFAQQGDQVRLQREIERLQSLYPGWQPPADPLNQEYVPDQDIITIWELFNSGDLAGARAAIAAKEAADPSFVPSQDLLDSLAAGEATIGLRTASDAQEWDRVISIAANNPALLTCANVDTMWRLAEAFAQTDATERAVDAYSYVLVNCTDAGERLATVQKAAELLDREAIEPLFVLEQQTDGVGEFAAVRLDLARRDIAASLDEGGAPALAADVELLQAHAEAEDVAEDLRLLGYYQLDRGRANEARRLFEQAYEADPSAASAEGLGVALIELRDYGPAEDVLSEFNEDSETLSALYLDAAAALLSTEPRRDLDSDVLGRIVDATVAARDANVAQELGWYAYAFSQAKTAVEWFTTALRWQADLEPAAYGLLVAADSLGDTVTVTTIQTQWKARSQRIADFGKTSSVDIDTTAPPLPQPRPAHVAQEKAVRPAPSSQAAPLPQTSSGAVSCQQFVPPQALSPGAALSHGWCLMNLNRPGEAVGHFARALHSTSSSTRGDAAYGQSLAYLRMGLTDNAAVAAAAGPQSDSRAIELQVAILSQKATAAYAIGDYTRALDALDQRSQMAPERNDLLTLRAWSYYHLRRYAEAERIFAAVAATGYGDAVSGLAAARSRLMQ
ncbi:tetratricopeptide repeat protein [Devosia sediminis]|uniref:Tetratricopeptide repeat protein n=1 Tax=Devosia sediminis TaxID=2798801 RepID=A0A934J0E1_9HYPH|nr:tetratricopeptide repeat protein [Devosia sediminis]MBJ3786475.1 tetratricopeptide repeat protein [Devosia sediminis]